MTTAESPTAEIRAYREGDRPGCLALFDSNVPEFFAPHERADFIALLDMPVGPYLVVTDAEDDLIACGGFARSEEDPSVSVLTWGMVGRDLHRRGVGRQLLQVRLDRIAADPLTAAVTIETTQFSRGFFERFGFVVRRIEPDGFGRGYDLVAMALGINRWRARTATVDC